jgi:hypothetical protein
VHQLDVKNAFLHGTLDEEVYCLQPAGFVDATKPDHVCRLSKSLYGLKQAPRAWFLRFANFVKTIGFVPTRSDSSLFIYVRGADMAYLLLYVDDMVLTASSATLLQRVIARLTSEFAMKDLGALHFFLGASRARQPASSSRSSSTPKMCWNVPPWTTAAQLLRRWTPRPSCPLLTVRASLIRPPIAASPVHSSTLQSRDRSWPTPSSKSACTCMIPVSATPG